MFGRDFLESRLGDSIEVFTSKRSKLLKLLTIKYQSTNMPKPEPTFEGKKIEEIAEHNERLIVKFVNIDKESFTHSFRGISITVDAGKDYTGRFPECDHLAKHLARKILTREKKAKGADKDPKGTILYTHQDVEDLKKKILFPLGEEKTKEELTPEARRKEDLKGIKEKFAPNPPVEVTKKQVIEDLKKRGITPDVNKSKEELLKQLMELEASDK